MILSKKLFIFISILIGSVSVAVVVFAACSDVCLDFDGDGYGNPASSNCLHSELDCDDTNNLITVGVTENLFNGNCGDGADNDCDGMTDCGDTGCFSDQDCIPPLFCSGDGCDVFAGENCNNCWDDCSTNGNGACDEGCGECPGGIHYSSDCDCGNKNMNCSEECDDGNLMPGDGCDSSCKIEIVSACVDGDGDGYDNKIASCPSGTDCNDGDGSIHPNISEHCDAIDWNCDGNDVDGIDLETCERACKAANPSYGWTNNGGSLNCCGNDVDIEGPYVGDIELDCGDNRDNDCDGKIDTNAGNEDEDCLPCTTNTFDNERLWYMGNINDCDQCTNEGSQDDDVQWMDDWSPYPGMADKCDADCGIVSTTVQLINYEDGNETKCDGIDNDCDGSIDEGCSLICTFPITFPCIFP